eukprot:g29978.t1
MVIRSWFQFPCNFQHRVHGIRSLLRKLFELQNKMLRKLLGYSFLLFLGKMLSGFALTPATFGEPRPAVISNDAISMSGIKFIPRLYMWGHCRDPVRMCMHFPTVQQSTRTIIYTSLSLQVAPANYHHLKVYTLISRLSSSFSWHLSVGVQTHKLTCGSNFHLYV